MDIKTILSMVDHTDLKQTSDWNAIKTLCGDAAKYGAASVCIPPCYVKAARGYADPALRICTVIGFPNGYSTTRTKVFEAADAVKNGADEIDMVININEVKNGNFDFVLNEIRAVRAACEGKILKVIVEACYLNEWEKVKLCQIVDESGADFIKTSTGFGTGGAVFDDVRLFAENVKNAKIKAAGGISSIEDAEKFIQLGAERLGTSRIVNIIKEDD